MSSLALRGMRCHACRRNILQSFVTIAGVTIPPSQPQRRVTAQIRLRANFSLTHSLPSNSSLVDGTPSPNQGATENATKEEGKQQDETTVAEHVPWYLQEAHAPETSPLSFGERQALPPLPENPPPILQELLEQLSVDIGLDDLSIFDLRNIHPPPALGANLIMIIGTARSEKHLNVSADRFCRWLRSAHKLRPVADGLLGRNELKIRLRRRARRAKLAKDIGRPEKDDGLTTGWICVNVGKVEDAPENSSKPKIPSFVGFGSVDDKPQIVVQMLTEEKRKEIDLDTLWSRRLERYKQASGEVVEHQDEEYPEEVRLAPEMTVGRPSNLDVNSTYSSRTVGLFEQRRAMHTSRPRLKAEPTPTAGSDASHDLSTASSRLRVSSDNGDAEPSASSLFRQLNKLSKDEARHELGQGPNDRDSTLFLRLFYRAVSTPSHKSVFDRFRLVQTALSLSHPNYNKSHLFEAFQDLAASGGEISASQGLNVVRTLLSPLKSERGTTDGASRQVSDADINMALKVLEHLSLLGINIIRNDIFLSFFTAVGYPVPVRPFDESQLTEPPEKEGTRSLVPSETLKNIHQIQNRLLKAMELVDLPLGPKEYETILRTLINHGNYDKFWEVWRKMALRLVPRQKEHYLLLFRMHAELRNQRETAKCLFDWVPMMSREEPPVYGDPELAQAILDCLQIADPDIKRKAEEGRPGQFVEYWKKCYEILGTAAI